MVYELNKWILDGLMMFNGFYGFPCFGFTLWLFNIAMENGPFIDDEHDQLPIENDDFSVIPPQAFPWVQARAQQTCQAAGFLWAINNPKYGHKLLLKSPTGMFIAFGLPHCCRKLYPRCMLYNVYQE